MARPTEERVASNLGVYVYGLAAIGLGLLGLAWGDFATNWQRVPETIPHHLALARAAAIYELAAGTGMLWRRTRRIAALLLTLIYTVFVLLWIVRAVGAPGVYDSWGNVFEEASLVIAGKVVFTSLSGRSLARFAGLVSRLYGICVLSYGVDQVFYLHGTASFVPRWIPPGQKFWAVATTICFLLAAAAILSGIFAGLATRLLTAMIAGFGLLVWLPRLIAQPHVHFIWSANAINFALMGAAWVVADSFAERDRRRIAVTGRVPETDEKARV